MERIQSAFRRVSALNAEFSEGVRSASTSRLSSLGDSTIVFLDDKNDVFMVDAGSVGGAWKVVMSCEVHGIDALVGSPGARLLALWGGSYLYVVEVDLARARCGQSLRVHNIGETILTVRPGLRIVDLKWHPSSDGHLTFLTSDGNLWIFDVARSVQVEEQRISARSIAGTPTGFSFGAASCPGWEIFSVYIVTDSGDMYVLCPVAPYGLNVSASLARALIHQADTALIDYETETLDEDELMMEGGDGGLSNLDEGDSSFFSEPSLGARARRKLTFSRGGKEVPWAVRQAGFQLDWLNDCVFFRDGGGGGGGGGNRNGSDHRAVILKPQSMAKLEPLLQGPMFCEEEEGDDDDDRERSKCRSMLVLDRSPPVFLRCREGNVLDVLLKLEDVEARWKLGEGEEEEDSRAGEAAAPALLAFEQVELPNGLRRRTVVGGGGGGGEKGFGAVFVSRGGSADETVFIRCSAGLLCLRMPWLSVFRDVGDGVGACAVADASSSVLSALIATEGGVMPLGGTAVFTVPDGTVALMLTADGDLVSASTAKSIRDWGIASVPPPLSRSAPTMKGERSQGEFERQLGTIVRSMPEPTRIAPEMFRSKTSMELLQLVQQHVFNSQDSFFRNFAELHTLVVERSEQCRNISGNQLQRIKDVATLLQTAQVKSDAIETKLQRVSNLQDNLTARIRTVLQIINYGSSKLSRAEVRLLADYRIRRKGMEARKNRVSELVLAANRLQNDIAAHKRRFESTSVSMMSPSLLRTVDRTRVHEALTEHSIKIKEATKENAELWREIREHLPEMR